MLDGVETKIAHVGAKSPGNPGFVITALKYVITSAELRPSKATETGESQIRFRIALQFADVSGSRRKAATASTRARQDTGEFR